MTKRPDYESMFRLDGKVALITGASKGIGEAIAHGLAAQGARVVVSSRKQDAVDAVAAAIRDAGGDATAVAANVGYADDRKALIDATVAACGALDILVNNAAANPVYGPLQDTDARAFAKIVDVNLEGPFELARLAYPLMKARGGGSVVNISSIGGLVPEHNIGIYSVSKAALISLTKAMAQDWGRDNIRANAICPGLIRTRFSEALWSDDATSRRFVERIALGRIGEPGDVVGLAVFLASDAAAYCSGGCFLVDGGYSANN